MQHLKNLRLANLVMAGLNALVGVGFGLVYAALGVFALVSGGEDGVVPGAIMLAAGVFVGALVLGFAVLFFLAGRKVATGQGRTLQTILGVLTVANIPIGTLYGGYALWVCWMNEETKKVFEAGGLEAAGVEA
jgi:hypothetical protein